MHNRARIVAPILLLVALAAAGYWWWNDRAAAANASSQLSGSGMLRIDAERGTKSAGK